MENGFTASSPPIVIYVVYPQNHYYPGWYPYPPLPYYYTWYPTNWYVMADAQSNESSEQSKPEKAEIRVLEGVIS